MDKKIFSLLGLCKKAGRLISGEFMVEKAVKDGSAKLVIVACDASSNTKKLFHNICSSNKVKILEFGDKASLGSAIGKEIRASIAIVDDGLTKTLLKHIPEDKIH